MSAKCPHCGRTLRWYNIKAECKYCGANIPNYNWEERLEEDADKAEHSFAKFHYKLANFKSGTVGSPLRIIRLVTTLLPLVALVVPLVKIRIYMPFYDKTESVSFLNLVLNYITKMDFLGGFKLMSATALGPAAKFLMFGVLAAFLAVAAGVLNFFVVLIASINLRAGFNVVLNVIATLGWCASGVLLMQFIGAAAGNSINILTGNVIWWGYAVGIVLFAVNVVINILVSKGFKKQLAEQPTLEQAVERELAQLRSSADGEAEEIK